MREGEIWVYVRFPVFAVPLHNWIPPLLIMCWFVSGSFIPFLILLFPCCPKHLKLQHHRSIQVLLLSSLSSRERAFLGVVFQVFGGCFFLASSFNQLLTGENSS